MEFSDEYCVLPGYGLKILDLTPSVAPNSCGVVDKCRQEGFAVSNLFAENVNIATLSCRWRLSLRLEVSTDSKTLLTTTPYQIVVQ